MSERETKVLHMSLALTIFICLLLLVFAAVWTVWINVMPALWPDGPQEIIRPDYLVFVGAMLLIKWLAITLRGSK